MSLVATNSSFGLSAAEARVGRRNIKGDRREQALLEGAYDLLRTMPLRNISIHDITERAGLSRSSFYFYFESKWQVLSALLARVTADVFRASQLIFERPPGVPPEAAIELLQDNDAYDLILVDYTMPGMSGGDLARHILKVKPGARLAILTGLPDLPDTPPCPVLTKGLRMSELVKAIEARTWS